MSAIVHVNKGLALACGLRWSVLDAAGAKASIRAAGRAIGASRYVIDDFEADKYLGLYTHSAVASLTMGGNQARRIHSLALVFICAVERSCDMQREQINAILSVTPEGDPGDTRAMVIIESGRIVHDSLQARGRATEIVNEYRSRDENFQLFADRQEHDEAKLVDLSQLLTHAGKTSLTQAIPRHPAQLVLALAALTAVALYGAHYRMVEIPNQRAQEARKKAEQDRTPLYLQALQEAMRNAGWSAPSLAQHLEQLAASTFFHRGWALKSLECNVTTCTESWSRQGGMVTDLMDMRPGGRYVPERSMGDKEAVIEMPCGGQAAVLTDAAIAAGGIALHKAIKPPLNTLENAGATGQFGETGAWPVMPMTGVRPQVIVKRTRLDIHFKYPFAVEALKQMPPNWVPDSYVLSTEQGMSISIKGFIYER